MVNFRNVSLTSSLTGQSLDERSRVLKTKIRKQMSRDEFNKSFVKGADNTKMALTGTFIFGLVMHFILDGASTYLKGMIRAM